MAAAEIALAGIGDPRAIAPLARLLGEGDRVAASALCHLGGEPAMSVVTAAIGREARKPEGEGNCMLMSWLAPARGPLPAAMRAELHRVAMDGSASTEARDQAMSLWIQGATPDDAPELVPLLGRADSALDAIVGLIRAGDPRGVDAGIAWLQRPGSGWRDTVAGMLAKSGDPRVVATLMQAKAYEAVAALRVPEATAALLDQARVSSAGRLVEERPRALEALPFTRDQRGLEAMLRGVDDGNDSVRLAVVDALRWVDEPRVPKRLAVAVRQDPSVRLAAAHALVASMRVRLDAALVLEMRELCDDPDPSLRVAGLIVVGSLPGEFDDRLARHLVALLAPPTDYSDQFYLLEMVEHSMLPRALDRRRADAARIVVEHLLTMGSVEDWQVAMQAKGILKKNLDAIGSVLGAETAKRVLALDAPASPPIDPSPTTAPAPAPSR
jgi:HEAT repeat protein